MTSQLNIYNNKTRKETLPSSNTPTHRKFDSYPFVVQSKSDYHEQPPNLKTSLIQAEKYGHHLSKTNLAKESVPTVVQRKTDIQSAIISPNFEGQTTGNSLNSKPVQMVQGKEEREQAKRFNAMKKAKAKEMTGQGKGLKTVQELKRKGKAKKQNSVTEKFDRDHLASSSTSMSSDSIKVAETRTWGNKDSGKSTIMSMSPQSQADEARYAVEGLTMKDTKFSETGSIKPQMGTNKATKFSYPTQTSEVTSDRQGKRKVKKGKQEYAKPVLGMKGDRIHHLHGVETEE